MNNTGIPTCVTAISAAGAATCSCGEAAAAPRTAPTNTATTRSAQPVPGILLPGDRPARFMHAGIIKNGTAKSLCVA
jgi:hypothetical protein